jgi:hypothetical protein
MHDNKIQTLEAADAEPLAEGLPQTVECADAEELGEALLQLLTTSEQDRRLALELDRWLSAQLRDRLKRESAAA